MRDDFSRSTKELLAKQAGNRCTHPHCGKPTSGANESGTDAINIGVAAHITAASVGGPRYDPALTREERKDASNGIWLCQDHAHAVDADDSGFSVQTLGIWKRQAQARSFRSLMSGMSGGDPARDFLLDSDDNIDIRQRFRLLADQDLIDLKAGLLAAAREDAVAFRRTRYWNEHAIELKLNLKAEEDSSSFTVHDLAITTEAFNEIVVLSSPGTGKTTTLLQLVDAIIDRRCAVACFIPLDDWSAQHTSLFDCILERQAFRPFRQDHLRLLAHTGELTLVLDGWNQLDSNSRKRARNELEGLRRDYPKLGIVISSRNLSITVPFATTVVQIQPLDHAQQRQVASAMRGADGETLLEEARAISGLRELVSVPLFLNAILRLSPGSRLPTTKEGILSAFVEQHNQIANRNESLRNASLGYEKEILIDLATEATRISNTSLPENRARASVQATQGRLVIEGQLSAYSAPQPMAVLDSLIAEHLLVQSSGTPAVYTFQHQQFQEWYASFAVEQAIKDTPTDQISANFLDVRSWEEPILFACERMASGSETDISAVGRIIILCLSIDPMLAAEIIFRAPAVWSLVDRDVSEFVQRWHKPGNVDRAIGFVVNCGRPEFAEILWPLLADSESHHHFDVLSSGRRFPASLLPDIGSRLAMLGESTRAQILGQMADNGGMEGALTASTMAQIDPSLHVKKEVVQFLYYAGADQQVARVLQSGPAELWQELASKHSLFGIHNAEVATRMASERRAAFLRLEDPGQKLYFLLNGVVDGIDTDEEIFALLVDPSLDVRANVSDHALHQAYDRCPSVVASALVQRIEQGLEIPFRAYLFVQEQNIVTDEESIRTKVVDATLDEKARRNAASIAGPISVGQLIDAQLDLDGLAASDHAARRVFSEQRHYLRGLVLNSPYKSLVAAVLERSDTTEPRRISLFAELLASHREQDNSIRPTAFLDDVQQRQLVDAMLRWVPAMVNASNSCREELAELARAIGSVGDANLAQALNLLLSEELRRWEISRAAFVASNYRDQESDARHSWTNWYQRAFVTIGTEQVESMLIGRLTDLNFGVDAASALMQLWERRHPASTASSFPRTFLREMTVRRGRRLRELPPAPSALAILDAVRSLLVCSNESEKMHAIRLSVAAFRMPCGDISTLVRQLIEIPAPRNLQWELYIALALSGECLQADAIRSCIRALLAESAVKPWVLGDHHSVLFKWIELLAFSEHPETMLSEVDSLEPPTLKQPHKMRGLLVALGACTHPAIDELLFQFSAVVPGLAREHEWLDALRTRSTESSGRELLRLLQEGAFDMDSRMDTDTLSSYLAQLARSYPAIRAEMLLLLDRSGPSSTASVIERVLLMLSDSESILYLVRYYARIQKSGDGLYMSIRKFVLDERPLAQFNGAVGLFPVPADDLRKQLFSLVLSQTSEARIAKQCLELIDKIRDDFGYPESEMRHPDIQSGQPWPMFT